MFPDDYYNNLEVPGEKELTSYLPRFWREILEMQANNKFAGYTLDRIGMDIDQLVKDRFFDSCSLDKLCDYERFLKIYNTEGISIEDRRSMVKMRWNSAGKMTGRKIKAIVKEFCGCDCKVAFGSSQMVIDMIFRDDPSSYMPMIRDTIQNSTIPGHIGLVFKGNVDLNIIFLWRNEVEVAKLELSTDFSMNHAEKYFDGSLLWDGSQKFDGGYNCFRTSSGNLMECGMKEHIECSVTIKKNLYHFDGSLNWDGSTKMNACVKKEEL